MLTETIKCLGACMLACALWEWYFITSFDLRLLCMSNCYFSVKEATCALGTEMDHKSTDGCTKSVMFSPPSGVRF